MITVGVIRGGISSEYEVSLKTGGHVLSVLREKLRDKYLPIDILMDKEGQLFMNGLPATWEDIKEHVDVIFNALHGKYGEDGQVQKIFEKLGTPYTGSRPKPSEISMHKVFAKNILEGYGIQMPAQFLIPEYNQIFDGSKEEWALRMAKKIHQKMSPPWIAKPVRGGSSVGVVLVKSLPTLIETLVGTLSSNDDVIIEEYIVGTEATVGVVENFRGEPFYTFLPIEIVKTNSSPFSYDDKYGGESREISPGRFVHKISDKLREIASLVHDKLKLSHYSRSDFIVHPKRGIYFLEVNALPGLTQESLIPKMADTIGSGMPEFVDHVISLALARK